MNKKKGQLENFGGLIQTLGFLAILLAVIFLVVAEVQKQVAVTSGVWNTSNSSSWTTSYNATNEVMNSMATVPSWLPIIVITVIGGLLLGLIQMFRR